MAFPSFASGDVLTATDMNAVGLWLVKTQTVGSAVSSVNVTSAFSASYLHYRIVYIGGSASADGDLRLTLGAAATGYYMAFQYVAYGGTTPVGVSDNNAARWSTAGSHRTTANSLIVDLFNPFASDETGMAGFYSAMKAGSVAGSFAGFLNNTTSYSDFTITPSSGTLTGGVIYVYGYKP